MNTIRDFSFLCIIAFSALSASCSSCQSQKPVSEPYQQVSPDFDADSAFSYIEKQVSFGPRVPMTPAHADCGDYLAAKLSSFGAKVIEQKATVKHYNGKNIEIRNIIGSFQGEKEKRLLLFAHWDSRPFADQENDPVKRNRPILGADDGASGVGVLLEVARQLQHNTPECGVDILFFDLEDWGQAEFDDHYIPGNWWCMGSQHWAKAPHTPDYKAKFGILLDMVGAPDATFMRESESMRYAANIVEKVWRTASKMGFGQLFIDKKTGSIYDDHIPVNQIRNIPCIDIINLKSKSSSGFASHWHTLDDTMQNINKSTLKSVGQTVLEVIFLEK
ncbi:MAG: M28 family peptidase [Dysgonamonadaceae bacterium]|jgi:Zn-dependent M28 family amino/carboxypeptidase|nr:M28 family peptidase [Dysgonamonadaceae bacterium]